MSSKQRLASWIGLPLALVVIAALVVLARPGAPITPPTAQGSPDSGITIEFLGWSHYRLTSPSGKVVVTNPYITNNPEAAVTLDEAIARGADAIVVPDGHQDELGDAAPIARATGARLVLPFELGFWLRATDAVPANQLVLANPGRVARVEGITIRILNAVHGSGVNTGADQTMAYGGPAVSFMITFENGYTVYFSGSSAATLDMGMWADLYKPDAAIIAMSDTTEPLDAGMVAKLMTTNNPNLRTELPHHHLRQPRPGGLFRPSELRTAMQQLGVTAEYLEPEPLRPYVLTK